MNVASFSFKGPGNSGTSFLVAISDGEVTKDTWNLDDGLILALFFSPKVVHRFRRSK